MLRSLLSVIAGTVIWTLLFIPSNQLMITMFPDHFGEDQTTKHAGILIAILIYTFVYSVVAGYATAFLARKKEIPHTLALGILQLTIGIFVQSGFWDVLPLWYHLIFLGFLLPGNLLGGWLRSKQ